MIKNFQLTSSTQALGEVEITAKATKARDSYMEAMKINSATTLDYVSSETMKKIGDNNVTSAVARVTGVSTNGGFITVRGIGDRYVKTAINGSHIPTLDPFTNNIKLDLFPASLVDNILITKTASPDLPGDWSGAYLSVETKDYPETFSLNLETTVGYNSQSTFNQMVSSDRSSTDWLGYDNNLREHNHDDFVSTIISPNQYQELIALGLGDYYHSLGVNENTPWNETYFKLGLVQLGLLAPALINDPAAVENARNLYLNGPYKSQAFQVINAKVPATGKSFPNNWNTTHRRVPLNFSQSLSIGNQFNLLGMPVGFIAGFRYGSSNLSDPHATINRAGVADDGNGNLIPVVSTAIDQELSRETNGWSALANLAFKLNPHHSISLLFMPNFNGVNNVRNASDNRDPANFIRTKSQFYEQRKQLVYQFKSEHYLPNSKIKLELNASYTRGNSKAPDFKNLQYLVDTLSGNYQIGGTIGDGIHRYYRYLDDYIFDSRIFAEIPMGNKPGLTRKVKIGGSYKTNDKKSDQYDYYVNVGPASTISLTSDDVNQFLDLSHFDIRTFVNSTGQEISTIDLYYTEDQSPASHTFGNSKIWAGFFMLDYSIFPALRISGGLRVEKASIFTDVKKFHALGLAPNDPRRSYSSSLPLANPGKLDEVSYLPSVNLIYKLRDREETPMNLRLNFSQTVARPSIRELSDVALFDYEYRTFVYGNSDLKMVHINNYDLRFENRFRSGDDLSASLFYKDFKNHIELVNGSGFTWQNVDKSRVLGLELEGRKGIGRHFEFRANVTLVNSRTKYQRTRLEIADGVKNYIKLDTVTRSMYGQSPYVLNGIFSYTADSIGLTLSVGYNVQGPRLVVASEVKEIPDVYELPRHLLDFKVSKKWGRFFSTSLTIRNILNSPVRRSYKYDEGYTLDYDRYTTGTVFDLGLLFKL